MTMATILMLAAMFLLVFGIAVAALLLQTRDPVKARLVALDERDAPGTRRGDGWRERLADFAEPLARLSVPADGWESSPLRLRFINAGWRAPSAPGLHHAGKSVLTLGLPLVVWIALPHHANRPLALTFLLLVSAAGIGYYLPDFVPKRRVATRQRDIFEGFPDALD